MDASSEGPGLVGAGREAGREADRARETLPDLHAVFDGERAFGDRDAPPRTRELAARLFEALAGELDPDARRRLAARLVTDGRLRAECAHDQNVYLGPLFTRRLTNAVPDLVLLAEDEREVAAALRFARAQDVPVTLRGAASTAMGGAVPSRGGLALDLARLDAVEVDAAAGRVRFGAGTRMRPLHAALRTQGLALGVYPSNLGGTYAGWLCTGGIGLDAYARGTALGPVRSADVVLPSGERVRLHADGALTPLDDADPAVLEPARAQAWWRGRGLPPLELAQLAESEGQLGALTALELDALPLPEIAAFLLAFETLDEAVAGARWVDERARAGALPAPGDLKLLGGSHVHHARRVWDEEDAVHWRARPSALPDAALPWRAVHAPGALGVPAADPARVERAQAFLFLTFDSPAAGRAFGAQLTALPGAPVALDGESARAARDRFRPQQVKRLGPGFLAAEILLPAERVGAFLPAAARLAERAGLELDAEVYFLSDGRALAIAGFLVDHREGTFRQDLLLAPMLLDLAMGRFEGRPYVLGRWQANLARAKLGAERLARLRTQKRALDPGGVVNRGSFFGMGLAGPLGLGLRTTIGPAVRALRLATSALPAATRALRGLAGRWPGPAAGRGASADEAPLGDGTAFAPRTASARAIACVNCGECNSVCPIFQESKVRLPQMLTHMGEELHAGRGVDRSGAALLDLCVRCGNCEEVCQAGIPHLPLYAALESDRGEREAPERERHVQVLERLRSSARYTRDFLGIRPGGYAARAPAALPGSARYVLLRAEAEAGPAATCIHCGACVDVCPTEANREYEGADPRWITTVQERCIGCGTCVEVCPANLANDGRTLRVMESPTDDWFAALGEFASRDALATKEDA